jgi:hypothetical protein
MEGTDEDKDIIPCRNITSHGIYFKRCDVAEEPADSFNAREQGVRQEKHSLFFDSITNHIAIICARISQGDYSSDYQNNVMEDIINEFYVQRKGSRQRIANDSPYNKTI